MVEKDISQQASDQHLMSKERSPLISQSRCPRALPRRSDRPSLPSAPGSLCPFPRCAWSPHAGSGRSSASLLDSGSPERTWSRVTRTHAVTVTLSFPAPARAQSRSFVKRQSEGDPVLLVQRWLSLGSRLLQPTAGSWAGLVHRHDRDVGSRVLPTLSVAPRPAGR